MKQRTAIAVAGALLCASLTVAEAGPANGRRTVPPPPPLGYSCSPNVCWWFPSYQDTPVDLRPQVFYGYEPHRPRGWWGDARAWPGRERRPAW
jgi:hypothetical protein